VNADTRDAFRQGLRELGWVEEQNVSIEYRWADGHLGRFFALAVELLRTPVDLILVAGGAAIRGARQATRIVPIVSAITGDPVAAGFAASLARPGGNVTGLAVQFEDLAGKQLQILTETVPNAVRIVILHHALPPNRVILEAAEKAAGPLGLKGRVVDIRDVSDLPGAFRAAQRGQADAMYVLPSPSFSRHRAYLAELAVKHRLPGIYENDGYVEAGGLMSYGPDFAGHQPQDREGPWTDDPPFAPAAGGPGDRVDRPGGLRATWDPPSGRGDRSCGRDRSILAGGGKSAAGARAHYTPGCW
jgi:putative ABC transport system substrate-binding protein